MKLTSGVRAKYINNDILEPSLSFEIKHNQIDGDEQGQIWNILQKN